MEESIPTDADNSCIVDPDPRVVKVVMPFDGEPFLFNGPDGRREFGGEITERFRVAMRARPIRDNRIVLTAALVYRNRCGSFADDACIAKLANEARIEWIVTGQVVERAGQVTVEARLASPSSSRPVRTVSLVIRPGDDRDAKVREAWKRVSAN